MPSIPKRKFGNIGKVATGQTVVAKGVNTVKSPAGSVI